MLEFGVTVLPDPPYQRLIELTKLAEAQGFQYGWTYDSHVLWQESFPLLTLAVQATSTMKFGHCVTNPGTREPTVLASGYAESAGTLPGTRVLAKPYSIDALFRALEEAQPTSVIAGQVTS